MFFYAFINLINDIVIITVKILIKNLNATYTHRRSYCTKLKLVSSLFFLYHKVHKQLSGESTITRAWCFVTFTVTLTL